MKNRTSTNNILQTRSGMAIVMMLILVPILMFLAMSFVDPIVRSFRSAVNDQKTLLAKNVADSMFEFALWDSRGSGVGENVKNENWPTPITRDYDFGTATIRWSVMGTPETDEDSLIEIAGQDFYTIPSPGSGSAGDDYCSTNEPVLNQDLLEQRQVDLDIPVADQPISGEVEVIEWPCHWNKLHEGESVVIPLYTEDSDGNITHPFENAGSTDFELRIRPACKPTGGREYDNQICDYGERYDLADDGSQYNTVIVLWEITGKEGDETGEDVIISGVNPELLKNSTFSVFALNGNDGSTNAWTPLNQNSEVNKNGLDGPLNSSLASVYKPRLRLITVHTLREVGTGSIVPYLEYQFKAPINISSDTPVSNTSKVVHVEVMIDGGYSETIEKTVGIAKSVSGFVIQQ